MFMIIIRSPVKNLVMDDEVYGDINIDKPYAIEKVERTGDKKLRFLVSWFRRGQMKPKPTWVTNTDLKNTCPELLVDYYESHLIFPRQYLVINNSTISITKK
jgi:hypothetical protein